jgi:Leucine-rich repeat (LRR) protein
MVVSLGVTISCISTCITFIVSPPLVRSLIPSHPTTPQLALNWVSDIDPLQYEIPTGLKEDDFQFVQRYVLSTLFFALRGTGWNETLNFMTEQNECGWFQPMELDLVQLETAVGVSCDADLHVTGLFLPRNKLKGSIPSELRYLSHLTMLAMPYNELTGDLPEGLSALSKLIYLDVRSNNLRGRIPTFVGDFEYLEVLGLSSNQFIGSVPPSLGTLGRLKTLALNQNILTGSLHFADYLTNLEYLYADDNIMDAQIGSDFLENLDRLRELDLSSNLLTCEEFPEKLLALPDLRVLDLAYNELGGSLPLNIPQNNVLKFLSLRGNLLNGTVSINLPALGRLSHLDLHGNKLAGSLPGRMKTMNSLTFLFLGDNDFYPGELPDVLSELTNLRELSMSNTQRDSYIPNWIALLSNLKLLDLSHNKLTGNIPDAVWNLPEMSYLLLHDNILKGTLPPTVAAVDTLKIVSLHRNGFSGSAKEICDAATNMDLFATDCSTGILCPQSCCPKCCRDDDDECFEEDLLHNLTSVNGDWDFNYKNNLYSFDPAILEESGVAKAIASAP